MENAAPTPKLVSRRLYRSTTDRVLGGVCGGLAAYFDMDPVAVRVAFIVFALAGAASVLLYLVLWIAVPSGETAPMERAGGLGRSETTAFVLIGAGALWLLANLGAFHFVNWAVVWPLALIALGAALLLRGASR